MGGYLICTVFYSVAAYMVYTDRWTEFDKSEKSLAFLHLYHYNWLTFLYFNIFCSPFKSVLIMFIISAITFSVSQTIIEVYGRNDSHLLMTERVLRQSISFVQLAVTIACFGRVTFFWRKVLLKQFIETRAAEKYNKALNLVLGNFTDSILILEPEDINAQPE